MRKDCQFRGIKYSLSFKQINVEHCLLLVIVLNNKTFRFVRCFRGFNLELGINYPFLIQEVPL